MFSTGQFFHPPSRGQSFAGSYCSERQAVGALEPSPSDSQNVAYESVHALA
jgi:hypothetical protein